MKLLPNYQFRRALPQPMKIRAVTLVELLVTMTLLLMLVMAMVSVQIFGFKINSLTTSKLKFTAASLKALDQIQCQVRGASFVTVGNGTNMATFSPTGGSGNALKIWLPSGSANLLYLDTNADMLFEIFGATGKQITLAYSITNNTAFQTVDCHGSTTFASSENYAIRMILQFAKTNYRVPTSSYDYYSFQTEMTPRSQQ
jgi:hypothetical protein